MSRAQFHQEHALKARQQAQTFLQQRQALGAKWFGWVAGQLYALSPAPYATMVRRELEQLISELNTHD